MAVLESRRVYGSVAAPIDMTMWWADGELCVALGGELDVFTEQSVADVVDEVHDSGFVPCRVVFMLDGVVFADSRGIRSVRAACDALTRVGCDVSVRGFSDRVRRAVETVGVPLPFEPS